jgi:hypothetical protein
MKKIFFVFCLFIFSNALIAQTFEYQFSGEYGKIYQVSENEFVYGILNDSTRQFNVYTLEHQLIKTFTMPQDTMYYGFLHLSKTLFNDDQKFELIYSWQDMNPYTSFGVRVVNEDGVVLFEAPGFWNVGLFNTQSGAKMVLSYPNGPNRVNVYSLLGTVLESEEPGNNSDSWVFPNPSASLVNITINVPNNEPDLILSIYTTEGKMVSQRNVDSGSKNIRIDISGLPTGIYLYRIHNDIFSTVSKKFIVTR